MRLLIGIVVIALLPMPPVVAQTDESEVAPVSGLLLPSEVLDSLTPRLRSGWAEARARGETLNQVDFVHPYMELVEVDEFNPPADPVQALSIGELLFLRFAPARADHYFEGLMDRDDWIGQHAWRRHMQIEFRARGHHDETRQLLSAYMDRFAPSRIDVRDVDLQTGNLMSLDFSEGRSDEAIDLLLEALARTAPDAGYAIYRLPERFEDSLVSSDRLPEVSAVLLRHLEGLRASRADMASEPALASDDPILTGNQPDWYWSSQGVLEGETFQAFHLRLLDDRIASLQSWFERRE